VVVDITFWVIQAVLLTPVLFMAASAGLEERPSRPRSATREDEPLGVGKTAARPVAVAVAGLSQFTIEQQARLVILRTFVQHGALSDDMVADAEASAPAQQPAAAPMAKRSPRLDRRQLLIAGAIGLMIVGLVGVVRTSTAMDDLQRTSLTPLSPVAQFVPGVIANPAKYLAAVNSGGRGNTIEAVNLMHEKEAMDRWEALIGIGLSMLLFTSASRRESSSSSDEDASMVAADVAPFILVAAMLFAALSFFELP
jgi:hypothetical protein